MFNRQNIKLGIRDIETAAILNIFELLQIYLILDHIILITFVASFAVGTMYRMV